MLSGVHVNQDRLFTGTPDQVNLYSAQRTLRQKGGGEEVETSVAAWHSACSCEHYADFMTVEAISATSFCPHVQST